MSNTDSNESIEALAKEMRLDAKTGQFYWERPRQGRRMSQPVGSINKDGYRVLRAFKRTVLEHRLVWFVMHGSWPKGEIDHINGNILDNRPENLRDVDKSVNQQNQRVAHRDSKTGFMGVSPTHRGDFRAAIRKDGQQISLGRFKTPEMAHEAYVLAKRKMHEGCTI